MVTTSIVFVLFLQKCLATVDAEMDYREGRLRLAFGPNSHFLLTFAFVVVLGILIEAVQRLLLDHGIFLAYSS